MEDSVCPEKGLSIIVAPASYKGSLTALQAARAMEEGIRRAQPGWPVRLFPLADGGEGTLDLILQARKGERQMTVVHGADSRPRSAAWGRLEDDAGPIAVIEVAQVIGLACAGTSKVRERSSIGVGEMLSACLDRGIRRIWVGLGGSSTNDGGAGLLSALGVKLLGPDGAAVAPTPDGLGRLARIDASGLDARLRDTEILVLSDVGNPLCGPQGASAVYGPQKGLASGEVALVDGWLSRFAEHCGEWRGSPLHERPGSGAAGGLGYAFLLLGAVLRSGADAMLDLLHFETALQGAGWVLTGEGRSDVQTLSGKAPLAVAKRARRVGVPVTLVAGSIDRRALGTLAPWFDGAFATTFAPGEEHPLEDAAARLSASVEQLARLRAAVCRKG
ncbi:MAG: glycerate kinase [Betaproteobacteria bacterium]|nr:glycerate kinase [Betaproteobacteria bacterium]